MKLVLLKSVTGLGEAGQVVNVKDGHARNYLIPQGLGQPATGQSLKYLEKTRASQAKKKDHQLKTAQAMAEKLAGVTLTIPMPAGENDRLFGTVTTMDISQALAEKGVNVDRRVLEIGDPIKSLGSYAVTAKLHADVHAPIKVEVVKEG